MHIYLLWYLITMKLIEDTKLSNEQRWIMIAPPGAKECCLIFAKATNKKQEKSIGNQTGGKVSFFLFTDNFFGGLKSF